MDDTNLEPKKMSRRNFLKTAGIGCGAAILVCAGGGALASLPPMVDFYETEAGAGAASGKKVLVTYASKAGSTAEVAEAIAKTLTEKGMMVDVSRIENVGDLGGYQAVLVGSCIRMGRWLPAAVKFVEKNQAALKAVPTAYFEVCTSIRKDTPEARSEAEAYLDNVKALVEPVGSGIFAGKVDFSKLSFLDRTIAKGVGSEEGDWRDWDAVRAWAGSII